MGGGRDNTGAALYKRVDGKYIRVGAYKDNEKEVNRLIDDLISTPSSRNAVKEYLKAIKDRDKSAVLDLDERLKDGKFGTGEQYRRLATVRKKLLEIAGKNPEKITEISESANRKISAKAKEDWAKLPLARKALSYERAYKGKRFRLKKNLPVGADWSKIALYEPAGTEVGTLLRVKAYTSGGPYEFGGVTYDGGPLIEHFDFLIDQGHGYTKWYPLSFLEVIK